jgi:hypothetical protein
LLGGLAVVCLRVSSEIFKRIKKKLTK